MDAFSMVPFGGDDAACVPNTKALAVGCDDQSADSGLTAAEPPYASPRRVSFSEPPSEVEATSAGCTAAETETTAREASSASSSLCGCQADRRWEVPSAAIDAEGSKQASNRPERGPCSSSSNPSETTKRAVSLTSLPGRNSSPLLMQRRATIDSVHASQFMSWTGQGSPPPLPSAQRIEATVDGPRRSVDAGSCGSTSSLNSTGSLSAAGAGGRASKVSSDSGLSPPSQPAGGGQRAVAGRNIKKLLARPLAVLKRGRTRSSRKKSKRRQQELGSLRTSSLCSEDEGEEEEDDGSDDDEESSDAEDKLLIANRSGKDLQSVSPSADLHDCRSNDLQSSDPSSAFCSPGKTCVCQTDWLSPTGKDSSDGWHVGSTADASIFECQPDFEKALPSAAAGQGVVGESCNKTKFLFSSLNARSYSEPTLPRPDRETDERLAHRLHSPPTSRAPTASGSGSCGPSRAPIVLPLPRLESGVGDKAPRPRPSLGHLVLRPSALTRNPATAVGAGQRNTSTETVGAFTRSGSVADGNGATGHSPNVSTSSAEKAYSAAGAAHPGSGNSDGPPSGCGHAPAAAAAAVLPCSGTLVSPPMESPAGSTIPGMSLLAGCRRLAPLKRGTHYSILQCSDDERTTRCSPMSCETDLSVVSLDSSSVWSRHTSTTATLPRTFSPILEWSPRLEAVDHSDEGGEASDLDAGSGDSPLASAPTPVLVGREDSDPRHEGTGPHTYHSRWYYFTLQGQVSLLQKLPVARYFCSGLTPVLLTSLYLLLFSILMLSFTASLYFKEPTGSAPFPYAEQSNNSQHANLSLDSISPSTNPGIFQHMLLTAELQHQQRRREYHDSLRKMLTSLRQLRHDFLALDEQLSADSEPPNG